MAFYSESLDHSQRVNLSEQAYLTIENDIFAFGGREKVKQGTFLNQVFKNYKDDALASISIVMVKEKQSLNKCFKLHPDSNQNKAIQIWLEYYEEKIKQKQEYQKGTDIKFRINNENFKYLTEHGSECNEDKYYKDKSQKPRISLYLKALFEEYAQKPLYAREKIYYAERFEIIRNAIEAGHQLKIQVASSEMYYVKPFRIDLATYHYLTGVSSPVEKDGEPSYQSASFRLSNMLSVIPVRSRSGYLTEKEKENLNKEIQQKGAQFLTANITDVRIKLTEPGVQKYNNQIHLRPACKEILPGNIYCFQCTEIQAEYYFFKFGKDAMVMEPESLATRFKSMYGKAWKIYESAQNTETIK